MQIGTVIREHRKMKNMTQEELANLLGVTASAVNKWENKNSCPDIMLLTPIARLLDTTLDELLSFHAELTDSEISDMLVEADTVLRERPYAEALQWARSKIGSYPNCERLILQLAVIFDGQREVLKVEDAEKYDDYFCSLYKQMLKSSDDEIHHRAAEALFAFYMNRNQYDKAEACLDQFSIYDPELRRKKAQLRSETGDLKDACSAYEELLFRTYPLINEALEGMYDLAVRSHDLPRAHMLAVKQSEMAKCFEMGKYYEVSMGLDIAAAEKDADATLLAMSEMLTNADKIRGFMDSPLYEDMEFKPVRDEYIAQLKRSLTECFSNEETFGFLKEDARWQELMEMNS